MAPLIGVGMKAVSLSDYLLRTLTARTDIQWPVDLVVIAARPNRPFVYGLC